MLRGDATAGQRPTATGCPFGASHAMSTPSRGANRAQLLLRLAGSGRDVVSYTIGGERNVLLNHPDHAQHVLGSNRTNYCKDTGANSLLPDRGRRRDPDRGR